jgi:hypothetical protein
VYPGPFLQLSHHSANHSHDTKTIAPAEAEAFALVRLFDETRTFLSETDAPPRRRSLRSLFRKKVFFSF